MTAQYTWSNRKFSLASNLKWSNLKFSLAVDRACGEESTRYPKPSLICFAMPQWITCIVSALTHVAYFSINQLVDYHKSCLLIGWATHCLLVIDHINFQIKNNGRKITFYRNLRFIEVSFDFFEIIFSPTSWFILKQLHNSPELFMSDSQLGCAFWLLLIDNSGSLSNCWILQNTYTLPKFRVYLTDFL